MKRRALLLGLLLVLGALAAVAVREQSALRARWLRHSIAQLTSDAARARLARADVETLERLAFDAEVADDVSRRWRQPALDELAARNPKPAPALLARYLRDARGLARRCTPEDDWPLLPELLDAEAEAAVSDPDTWLSLRCTEHLRFKAKTLALASLRRIASSSRHEPSRFAAVGGLIELRDPANVPALVAATSDASARVRVAAAGGLYEKYRNDAGVQVLVDALAGDYTEQAVQVLGRVREKRAVAALARCWETRRIGRGALQEITGELVAVEDGETWSDWVQAHEKELPPQLSARGRDPAR